MRGAIGLLACVLVCVAVPAQAELQNCTITWTPNSEADLFGYKLYVAPTPRGYVKGSPGVTIGIVGAGIAILALILAIWCLGLFVLSHNFFLNLLGVVGLAISFLLAVQSLFLFG